MSDAAAPKAVSTEHVAKGVGTTMLARLGAVIELVAQPLYVAMFGLAGYGFYAVLWAAVSLIENTLDLGMTSAMQRTVPQAENDRAAVVSLRSALIMGVGPCLIAAILGYIYAPHIAPWLNVSEHDQAIVVPAIRLFIWALPLWACVEIATSALRAKFVFGAEIRLRIMWEQIMRLVLAVLFWFLGWGLMGLFIAHLISLSITVLLSIRLLAQHYLLPQFFTRDDTGMFGHTVKAGLAMLPANVIARLFGDTPSIILNLMLPGAAGAAAAGLYVIARKISSLVQAIRTTFTYVLTPLAASAARQDKAHVQTLYAYATRLTTALAIPLSITLAAMAPPILEVFGKNAHIAIGAVAILLVGRAIDAILGNAMAVLQVMGKYSRQLPSSITGLIVYAAAAWGLVQLSPLNGMALAVSLGLLTVNVIPAYQLWRDDGLLPFDADYARLFARALVIALGCGAIILLLDHLPTWAALITSLPVALAAIWLTGRFALSLDDRLSLGKTARKLRFVPQAAADPV